MPQRLLAILSMLLLATAACGPSAADRTAESAANARAEAEATAARQARAESAKAFEAERLKALWNYAEVAVGKSHQRSAAIKSSNDVDTGGDAPHSVMLVFRDHPAWGRSSYLVLDNGDFRCAPTCTVSVAADVGAAQAIQAHRPNTREAIALFIDDWRTLWRVTTGATRIGVTFAVKAGGTRTATFDVSGLDPTRMPGWPGRAAVSSAPASVESRPAR